MAYGLPSFEAGQWWTLLTGPLFGADPLAYFAIICVSVLFIGFAEARIGTRWAMAVTLLGQSGAVLLAAMFLFLFRDTEWAWARHLADVPDVGISAGAMCAGAVASATLASPWRQRLRFVGITYVVVSMMYVGGIADLEHLLGAIGGLVAAHWLRVPGAAGVSGRMSRREWRLLAVAGLVLLAIIQIVVWLVPGPGPLGDTVGLSGSAWQVLFSTALIALLVNGLRRGRRSAWRWTMLLCILNILLALAAAALWAIGRAVGGQVAIAGPGLFASNAVIWTAECAVLLMGREAFLAFPARPGRLRSLLNARSGTRTSDTKAAAGEHGRDRAADILVRQGGGNLSWMTTWPENTYFFPEDGDRYLAYRVHAGVAVALGDPVGASASRADTLTRFAEMCDRTGLVPCVFSATARAAHTTTALGWRSVQVAEDTVIDLADLEFRGKAWQDVRTALNRAKKEGIRYELVTLSEQPRQTLAQVRSISDEWVGDKGLPEMGFTLGGVEEALDPRMRVGLARDVDGRIHGVTSWMPVYDGKGDDPHGWTLDLMRRREGFRPVVEFLLASSCLALREEGAQFLSLSGAPLAQTGAPAAASKLDRMLDQLGGAMEPYYGFRSLHAFKAKFQPRYEPMYLLYRDEADLPRIGVALLRCYMPSATVRDLLTLPASRS